MNIKRLSRIMWFGLILWAAPFFLGAAIFTWVPPESELFDSLVGLALGTAACVAALRFWKLPPAPGIARATVIGCAWMGIAITMDCLFFFGGSEMKIGVSDYVYDIGLEYFLIPIVCASMSVALRRGGPDVTPANRKEFPSLAS